MTPSQNASTLTRIALGCALLAFLVHLGLGAGGVWSFEALNYDDPQVLALASDKGVDEILTEPVWYAYKPVYFLSIKIDTLFGDAAVGVAHVHNVLLHALATALLVIVLGGLVRNPWIAGAVGLLFAAHPVHAESVAWLSGRKDVLSLVFVLTAHLQYRRARADEGRVSYSAPLFLLLGGLTKGTVWVWAGVLLLDEIVEAVRAGGASGIFAPRRILKRLAPCLIVGLLGVVLDAWMAVAHGPGAVDHGVGLPSLAAAMAGVHARYVLHLVVPIGLSIDYAVNPAGSWAVPLAWVGLLLLLAAIGLFVVSIRRRWTLGILASGLWILGLLPVNNIWPSTAILMADRYLYLPAAGLYLLLLGWLATWPRGRTAVLVVLTVLFAVLGGLRTAAFKDSATVWAAATDTVPASALAWFQRGQAAAANGEWENGIAWSNRAIELEPRPEILVRAHLLKTGALLGRMGRRETQGRPPNDGELQALYDQANRASREAQDLDQRSLVRQDPKEIQAEAQVLRGKVLERLRDPASALEAYERAWRLFDGHATAHYDYATLLASTGTTPDLRVAEDHLEKARRLRPGFLDAAIQLAIVKALQGRDDEALEVLRRAEQRHGRTGDLLFAQAQVHLAAKKEVDKAEALLQELKRRDPNHPKASRLLSDIRLAQGRILLEQGRETDDRAKLRDALERFESAGRALERCWQAEVGAGDAYLRLGLYRKARERYQTALIWSRDLPWVRRLAARAGVLEAAWTARFAEDDLDREEAARLAAGALKAPLVSVDLGFLGLREELPWIRRSAARLAAGGAPAEQAARVLRAAVLAATGDDEGANREIRGVLRALSPDTAEKDTLDAAILLRGLLRDRARAMKLAMADYELLMDRRPDAPLPELRLRQARLAVARNRLEVAKTNPRDRKALDTAARDLGEALEGVQRYADAHPDLLAAGLLATEGDMHRGDWIPALRRLNALREAFPREADVYRGLSAIYLTWYLRHRDQLHIREGERALRQALTLDPRDPQTLLDASQLARVAGQLKRAMEYARRALTFELLPNGPAARALSDLYLAFGRQALEKGDRKGVRGAFEAARKADPGAAAPWVLWGDFTLKFKEYDAAVAAYRTAKELEPWSPPANRGLSKAHATQARQYEFKALAFRDPPRPEEADPEAWAALDETGRREATQAWERAVEKARRGKDAWRRQERRALEAALRLDPDAEDAPRHERRLRTLRDMDPEARRRAYQEAEALYERGVRHLEDGELGEALGKFQQAVDAFPDHVRAHFLTAQTVYQLLAAGTATTDEEREVETRWWLLAFEALHATDTFDPHDRFPDRYLVRARLHDLRWRRERSMIDKIAAVRAYERYVRSMEALERGEKPAVAPARKRLKELGQD